MVEGMFMAHSRIYRLLVFQLLLVTIIFAQTKDAKYVGSKNSDKDHYTTCQWAKKISSSNLVTFKTVDEAKKAGYKACRVCRLPSSKKQKTKAFHSSID